MAKTLKHPRLYKSHDTRKVQPNNFRKNFKTEHEVFVTQSEVGVNSVMVNTCTSCTSDIVEEMDKYKLSDFSITNLQAIGAPLNPVYATPNAIDTVIKATNYVDKLDIPLPDNKDDNNNNNK